MGVGVCELSKERPTKWDFALSPPPSFAPLARPTISKIRRRRCCVAFSFAWLERDQVEVVPDPDRRADPREQGPRDQSAEHDSHTAAAEGSRARAAAPVQVAKETRQLRPSNHPRGALA